MRRVVPWAAVAAAVTLVGCGGGDGGGGGGGLSTQEQAALAQVLATSGALGGSPIAGFAPFALAVIDEVGSMGPPQIAAMLSAHVQAAVASARSGSYEGAFGIEVTFSINIQGVQQDGYVKGVVGWNGLATNPPSVDELVTVALVGLGLTPPPNGTYAIGEPAFASYYNGTSLFVGTGGDLDLASDFPGGSTSCSQSSPPYTITCSYKVGTMTGDFAFAASGQAGSYDQPNVAFTLPAVQMNLTITD